MVSGRPAWLIVGTRPPPRTLSRRLRVLPTERLFSNSTAWTQRKQRGVASGGRTRFAVAQKESTIFDASSLQDLRTQVEQQAQEPDLESLQDADFKINLYEQDRRSNSARKATQTTELSIEDERDLQDDIDATRAELEGLQLPTRPTAQEIERFFGGRLALAATSELGSRDDLEEALRGTRLLPHHIATDEPLPKQSALLLEKLNRTLDEASVIKHKDEKTRKETWSWYLRCKHAVPGFVKMVPIDAWTLLWDVQSRDSQKNPSRFEHLSVLAGDKQAAGWPLTTAESLVHVEGLYLSGLRDEALREWQRLDGNLNQVDFLEAGIRMHAMSALFDDAESLVQRLLATHGDPRVAQSLVRSLANDGQPQRAWQWYSKLREVLGGGMKMQDYDETILIFMDAGLPKLALSVFRDMMLTGDPQQALYHSSFSKLLKQSQTATDTNQVALTAMELLPARLRNKFFFGSWIKKLIGDSELNAAAQVLELMYELGVRPDARYLNGLIGAWLREASAESVAKAERLGLLMIQQRLSSSCHRSSDAPKARFPTFLTRTTPEATIETWCVLGDHYLRHNKLDELRHVRDLLAQARLKMNAYFMNIILQAELQTRGPRMLWARFEVMTRSVVPDMDSWLWLWQGMRHHLDTMKNSDAAGFPKPRQLFALMLQWFKTLTPAAQKKAVQELDAECYNCIFRALSFARDLNGVFVALHQLFATFGAAPDAKTTHAIVMLISRLDAPKPRPNVTQALQARKRKARMSESLQNVAKASEALEMIRQHRLQELQDLSGQTFEQLTSEQQVTEAYKTVLAFVHAVLEQREEAKFVQVAAREMGVDAAIDIDSSLSVV